MLQDETNAYANAEAQYVAFHGAIVPALWSWEVQNILLSGLRRKRISEDQMLQAIGLLSQLAVTVDVPTPFGAELALARQYGLTVYDAAYLELAMRVNAKLATNDSSLASAARSATVLFEPSSHEKR